MSGWWEATQFAAEQLFRAQHGVPLRNVYPGAAKEETRMNDYDLRQVDERIAKAIKAKEKEGSAWAGLFFCAMMLFLIGLSAATWFFFPLGRDLLIQAAEAVGQEDHDWARGFANALCGIFAGVLSVVTIIVIGVGIACLVEED